MRDAEERGEEPAVEAGETFGGPDLTRPVDDGGVGAGGSAAGREHACFDYPDWVCEDGGEDAWSEWGQC